MNRTRRSFTRFGVAGLAALAGASRPAVAQPEWPARPIRIVVPTPAGSGPDVDLRHIAQRLQPLLGQPIVVDNRPGAATRIAAEAVAKAAPDGYTFLLGTPSLTTMASLYEKLPFDPRRDLVPVSLLSTTAYALTVNAAVPAQDVASWVALARRDATHANVATFGAGSIPHLSGAWFQSLSGAPLQFVHYATQPPYPDLLAGQTHAMFEAMLPMLAHVKAGRLRMLAISGSARHPLLPGVPTFGEAGFDRFDPMVWVGILAPAGTPAAIVQRMSEALAQVARMPEVVQFRRDVGSESRGSTPAEFDAFLEAERRKWGGVIQRIGLRLE
jgi:tripartite-type tricarboxylate transporter receptor subunit TctC